MLAVKCILQYKENKHYHVILKHTYNQPGSEGQFPTSILDFNSLFLDHGNEVDVQQILQRLCTVQNLKIDDNAKDGDRKLFTKMHCVL